MADSGVVGMRTIVAIGALFALAACGGGGEKPVTSSGAAPTQAMAPNPTGGSAPAPTPAAPTPTATPTSLPTTGCSGAGAGTTSSTPNPDNFNPCNPRASGYEVSFNDEFDSINTIDLNYALQPAAQKNWYFKSFWNGDEPPAKVKVENGVLSLEYMPGVYGMQTASPDGKGSFVGRAFGGGGYFEARIAFNPDAFGPGSEGIRIGNASWPAFWSMGLEHGIFWTGADDWAGQGKDFKRFIENDFFEYLAWGYGASQSKNSYAAVLHDWYGVWGTNCGNNFCDALDYGRDAVFINLPFEVNWNEFNTIGQLWKPARNGQAGYALNFFNGRPVSINYWYDERNNIAPPDARNRFSIMDRQRLFLVLGTGPGSPIRVDYVRVWQKPAERNNTSK